MLALRKQLLEVNPGNVLFRRHLGRTYGSLGQHQLSLGHTQEALSFLRESRALLHQVVIAHPNPTKNQDYLASACGDLGSVLASLGQHEEARDAYKEARTMYQNLVRSNAESAEYKSALLEIEARLAESEKASKPAVPGSAVVPESPAARVSRAGKSGP